MTICRALGGVGLWVHLTVAIIKRQFAGLLSGVGLWVHLMVAIIK